MAYHTEAVSSPEDIIAALTSFAGDQMWTVNDSDETMLSFSLGNIHGYIRKHATLNQLEVSMTPDYDSALGDAGQLNQSPWKPVSPWDSHTLSKVYIFSGTDYVSIIIEYADGYFRNIFFGQMVKAGVWNGGAYVSVPTGSSNLLSGISIRTHMQGAENWVHTFHGLNFISDFTGTLIRAGIDPETGVSPLMPAWVFSNNAVASSGETYLGYLPGLRRCSLKGRSVGSEVTLGSDVWKIFPFYRRTERGLSAVAYKK